MELIEYQKLTERKHGSNRASCLPLRDIPHGGVLYTFCNRSAPDRGKRCGPSGQAARPSITYKIKPCWVTLLQPARRAAVLDQPSRLRRLHWWSTIMRVQDTDKVKIHNNLSCTPLRFSLTLSSVAEFLVPDWGILPALA